MKKVFSYALLLATAFAFAACGDDEDEKESAPAASYATLTQTEYVMNHEDTQSIEGTNLENVAWVSRNEFAATVKDGIITGGLVGKSKVVSADESLSFTVEVKPKYNTFETPYLNWKASKDIVKDRLGKPATETTTDEGGEVILYQTSNRNAPLVIYTFTDGKMDGCGILCDIAILEEIKAFLNERYTFEEVDEEEDMTTYLSCYGKLNNPRVDYAVGMIVNEERGSITVAYAAAIDDEEGDAETKSRSANAKSLKDTFKAIEKAME